MRHWITNTIVRISLFIFLTGFFFQTANAQYVFSNDSAFRAGAENTGRLWGYAFGDFAYKGHSDSLSRGGSNQYSGVPVNRTMFQFRRIYLGYDFNISNYRHFGI